jgi:putative addiction module component (TIGR02574 family)
MDMKLAGLPNVRALSPREKLQLLDDLWRDVARDLNSVEVSEAEKELLDQRWAAFLRNPDAGLTLKQFQQRLKTMGR